MAEESGIAIKPSTAPSAREVRTLVIETSIDGTVTETEMQVIAVADSHGRLIDDFQDQEWQQDVLEELKKIRRGIGKLVGDCFLNDE